MNIQILNDHIDKYNIYRNEYFGIQSFREII